MDEYQRCTDELSTCVNALSTQGASGLGAFSDLLDSVGLRGKASAATKALLGVALSVATRDGNAAFSYAREAPRAGIGQDQLRLALARGVLMVSGPATTVAAKALWTFREANMRSKSDAFNEQRSSVEAMQSHEMAALKIAAVENIPDTTLASAYFQSVKNKRIALVETD
ncbi:MAG: hypothetical protein AAGD92_06825 [Pseudomonadota bacterium]